MKSVLFSFLALFSFSTAVAQFQPIQRDGSYQVLLDLTAVEDDELPVQIVTPLIDRDSVEFHLPRIIPGTYVANDYGRFVNDLIALTGGGDTLPVEKIDENRWAIGDASNLYKIVYTVDDTYDTEEPSEIFEPAGTSLSDSAFLLNNFGFVGYVNDFQQNDFELRVKKAPGFYGSTALRGERSDSLDVFTIKDYFTLHDNPIMYSVPDTATRMVGGTEVLVSVYSPNDIVNAKESMESISRVLDASAEYLGGDLPVDKYAVLIYTQPFGVTNSSYGALEHHTSTVLYMPEFSGDRFYSSVSDITAHEFFHIVTPLRIHSQMVADFNFIDPEMSEHIWLYEGVTEYNSHLVQIRDSIYSLEEYLDVLQGEFQAADNYNEDIPLTVASAHTHTFMHDQYLNFYQKGALAGMALDLKLIELSDGDYRLVDLLNELGQTYGADTFFVDDNLFDIISKMTYPELREFFALHYEGAVPFPYEDLLANVGIEYVPSAYQEEAGFGNVVFDFNVETGRLRVTDISEINGFGEDLGWEEGDELVAINGVELSRENFDVLTNYVENTEAGEKVKFTVARPKGEDDYKQKKLKAKAVLHPTELNHILRPMDSPGEEQLRLREVWINH